MDQTELEFNLDQHLASARACVQYASAHLLEVERLVKESRARVSTDQDESATVKEVLAEVRSNPHRDQIEKELARIRMQFHEVFAIPAMYRSIKEQEFLQAAYDALYKPASETDLEALLARFRSVRPVEEGPFIPLGEESLRDRVMNRSTWLAEEERVARGLQWKERHHDFLPGVREDGRMRVGVYWLNMNAHPDPARIRGRYLDVDRGVQFDDLGIVRMTHTSTEAPILKLSRYWYNRVGRPHLWYERNLLTDSELFTYYRNPLVDLYAFTHKNVPMGFAELDWREPGKAQLAYFGLFPEYHGQGYGRWALDTIVDVAWTRNRSIQHMVVNTNELDHRAASHNYQRGGFTLYHSHESTLIDPRVMWPALRNDYQLESYPWPKTPEYARLYETIARENLSEAFA